MLPKRFVAGALGFAAVLAVSDRVDAAPIPAGWTCVGTSDCGAGTPSGDVTAPPSPFVQFAFVTTNNPSFDLNDASRPTPTGWESNGSRMETFAFSLTTGDTLSFAFNYVTTDSVVEDNGNFFADYAWAGLRDTVSGVTTQLFTAGRQSDDIAASVIGGRATGVTVADTALTVKSPGPSWEPLGFDSGTCRADPSDCGLTDWISMSYLANASGVYQLIFAVTNDYDEWADSGLAVAGVRVNGVDITPIPEPGTLALLGMGLLGLAALRRRRAA